MVPSACRISLQHGAPGANRGGIPRGVRRYPKVLFSFGSDRDSVNVMRIYGLIITAGVTWAIFHALGIPLSSLLALVK